MFALIAIVWLIFVAIWIFGDKLESAIGEGQGKKKNSVLGDGEYSEIDRMYEAEKAIFGSGELNELEDEATITARYKVDKALENIMATMHEENGGGYTEDIQARIEYARAVKEYELAMFKKALDVFGEVGVEALKRKLNGDNTPLSEEELLKMQEHWTKSHNELKKRE
jgi:hypothetical protein